MKLSQRTLVTPPLLGASFFHLVQGGASWRATLAQLSDFLFGTDTLVISYTGKPFGNLVFGQSLPFIIAAPVAGPIVSQAFALATAKKFWNLNYSEGGGNNANPSLAAITLASLSFDTVQYVGGNFINRCPNLASLSYPAMIVTGQFAPTSLPSLTALSIPELVACNNAGNFAPATINSLVTLSAPKLAFVGLNFAPNGLALCTTFDFPLLATVMQDFAPTTMAALAAMSLPALQNVGGNFSVSTMAALASFSAAAMVNYGGTIALNTGLGNLTSCVLGTPGTLKSIAGATVNVSGQKLPSAQINAILALLVSLDGTNGTTLFGAGKTVTLNGGTNGAPTGQGITDKATLIARGATVTTN